MILNARAAGKSLFMRSTARAESQGIALMNTSRDSIDEGNTSDQPRHDWTRCEAQALHELPFADLIFRAQGIHRRNFDPNHLETASLLSIKTGGCPEGCGFWSQSPHHKTGV